jgi:anion-transporting  ArsA/GET3 family ATPase
VVISSARDRNRSASYDQFPASMQGSMEEARRLFRDTETTEFIIVTIPTVMAMAESDRLAASLFKEGVPVRRIVVNQMVWYLQHVWQALSIAASHLDQCARAVHSSACFCSNHRNAFVACASSCLPGLVLAFLHFLHVCCEIDRAAGDGGTEV